LLQGSLGELRNRIDSSGRAETLEDLFFRLIEAPDRTGTSASEPAARS
jgi:hypothetical protein